MRRTAWWTVCVGAWLAAEGCEHYCPDGYYKQDGRCYRVRDAGSEGGADGDVGDVDRDDASPVGASDGGSAAKKDGGTMSVENGGDAGFEGDAAQASCALECGDHEACQVIDGREECVCAAGYMACEGEAHCIDVMTNPLNCGSCAYACAQGLSCEQGECEQRIRELVLDAYVSCALYESPDGNYPLKCWGDGQYGLFRDGVDEALTPRHIAGVPRVRALALFGPTYCMVLPGEDKVRCWGGGEAGGGSGSAFSPDFSLGGVTRVSGAGGETFDAWGPSVCALHGVGDVSCWGAAGVNGAGEDRMSPRGTISIENHRTFSQLDGGYIHTCAVSSDGRVGCWGAIRAISSSENNLLGAPAGSFPMGAEWSSGVFVQKETGGSLTGVVRVAVGTTSCATTTAGELWCWGPNRGAWRTASGILGVGDEADHQGAVKVALDDVADVALGWGAQACAIKRSGQVYCWGSVRHAGQGAGVVGDSEDGSAFATPQAVPGLSDALEIQLGAGHACARRRNGQVLCWGQNSVGELGDGTKVERLSPTPVIGLYE